MIAMLDSRSFPGHPSTSVAVLSCIAHLLSSHC